MTMADQFHMTLLMSTLFIIVLNAIIFTVRGEMVPPKDVEITKLWIEENKISFDIKVCDSYFNRKFPSLRGTLNFNFVVKNHVVNCRAFQKYSFFVKKEVENHKTMEIPLELIDSESVEMICYGYGKNKIIIWAI